MLTDRETEAEMGSAFGGVEADNDGDVKTGSNCCESSVAGKDEYEDLQDEVCWRGGMSRLATPEVGILGWRAGMPGWMVGGPGASVIRARSAVAIFPSIRLHHQLSVFKADGGQHKGGTRKNFFKCSQLDNFRIGSASQVDFEVLEPILCKKAYLPSLYRRRGPWP